MQEQPAECTDQSERDPLSLENVVCSGAVYGYPSASDCEDVVESILNIVPDPFEDHEFLGVDATTGFPEYQYPKVQTPTFFRNGIQL